MKIRELITEAPAALVSELKKLLRTEIEIEMDLEKVSPTAKRNTILKRLSRNRQELKKITDDISLYDAKKAEVKAAHQRGKRAGVKQTQKSFAEFKKSLSKKINALVAKAEGLDFDAEFEKKKLDKVQSSIKNHLSGIVQEIENAGTSPDVIKFLDAALGGEVIDMRSLVAAKSGSIDDHINPNLDPKVKALFDDDLKKQFFGFIPGGTTAGNYGPAEVGLAILGNPAKKAIKGDLDVDGTMFELKGSGYKLNKKGEKTNSSYGARLNSKGIGSGTSGWTTLDKEIQKLVPQIRKTNPKKNPDRVTAGATEPGFLRFYNGSAKEGKVQWKEASRYNFNPTGIKRLNEEILGPVGDQSKTYNLLLNVIKAIVNGWKKVDNFEKNVMSMVNSDGTINPTLFNKHYSAIAYDSYNKEDEVENILFINSYNRNYFIIADQQELLDAIDSKDILIAGGITWNDDQQKATPQYVRP